MGRTPSRLHGRSESSPKHFSIELYSPMSPPTSTVDLSFKNSQVSQNTWLVHISPRNWICKHNSHTIQKSCTYPTGNEHASTNLIQYKNHAHILRELNMQAQIPYKSERKNTELVHLPLGIEYVGIDPIQVVHISSRNWTCRHVIQILRTYPTGIKHAGTAEEVEIKIETKFTPRQETHQNR